MYWLKIQKPSIQDVSALHWPLKKDFSRQGACHTRNLLLSIFVRSKGNFPLHVGQHRKEIYTSFFCLLRGQFLNKGFDKWFSVSNVL